VPSWRSGPCRPCHLFLLCHLFLTISNTGKESVRLGSADKIQSENTIGLVIGTLPMSRDPMKTSNRRNTSSTRPILKLISSSCFPNLSAHNGYPNIPYKACREEKGHVPWCDLGCCGLGVSRVVTTPRIQIRYNSVPFYVSSRRLGSRPQGFRRSHNACSQFNRIYVPSFRM